MLRKSNPITNCCTHLVGLVDQFMQWLMARNHDFAAPVDVPNRMQYVAGAAKSWLRAISHSMSWSTSPTKWVKQFVIGFDFPQRRRSPKFG